MRGKPELFDVMTDEERIPPADAGKTHDRRRNSRSRWDHPRGCGENIGGDKTEITLEGSPPRMRGKLCEEIDCHCAHGITPADAGKTRTCQGDRNGNGDHPRGCGENTKKIL